MERRRRREERVPGEMEGGMARVRKCVFSEGIRDWRRANQWAERSVRRGPLEGMPCGGISGNYYLRQTEELTFFMITSYAEIRSVATKSRVCASTSYKSLTFPSAILGRPSIEVESRTVSAIVRFLLNMRSNRMLWKMGR
jgi:hypothetical protein